jgi:hypothetical protein
MPWIYARLEVAALTFRHGSAVKLPTTLFSGNDPRIEFAKIMAEFTALALRLAGDAHEAAAGIAETKKRMWSLARRLERLLDDVAQLGEFFQPRVLMFVAELANEYDNPKKRKYEAGLNALTCKRHSGSKTTIQIPLNFKLPDRKPLATFRGILTIA